MAFAQSATFLCVAALAMISFGSGQASPPQASSPSISDEILKVRRLVDGGNVALSENSAEKPVQFDEAGIRQDPMSQQQEPWVDPEAPSSYFQGTVQEMSNLLASNRKLRHNLEMMQRRDAEFAKERVKLNEQLTSIALMAETSNKDIVEAKTTYTKKLLEEEDKEKALVSANEKLQQSNVELQQSNTELQVANAKLEASNGELLGSKTKLLAANAELQTENKQLQGANSEFGQIQLLKNAAEEKARKAEKEAELMASQMHTAQVSMQHTQDMVRKLLPRIKKKLQKFSSLPHTAAEVQMMSGR